MKYLARRLTGDRAWLHNDLPLSNVQRTRALSGPGGIAADIEPELRERIAEDGRPVIEDWNTIIYAVDEEKPGQPIVNHGIVIPPTTWEEAATRLTCAGVSCYPQGMTFDTERFWGPGNSNPKTKAPEIPRPDPLQIVQDLWDYLQAQPNSDLGVVLTGDLRSGVRIGTYDDPYRLVWWESPDIGDEIDKLAESTPFDYIEDAAWVGEAMDEVAHTVRIGWPRLGGRREDLRFVLNENIVSSDPAESPGAYANDVLGIGNGEGRTMVMSRSTVLDGRLRRTKIVTDKTLGQYALNRLTVSVRERSSSDPDIASVKVREHPNAPLASIVPGDDIYIQTHIPAYGPVRQWSRVMAVTEADDSDEATLTLRRVGAFLYSPTASADLGAPTPAPWRRPSRTCGGASMPCPARANWPTPPSRAAP